MNESHHRRIGLTELRPPGVIEANLALEIPLVEARILCKR
jgi:hypothetical protein